MIKKLFFITTLIFITTARAVLPIQFEAHYKHGNTRGIFRPSAVIPVWQKNNTRLAFISLIGMMDTKSAKEGNLGFGYRQLQDKYIIGGYGFYDFRYTKNNNKAHQLTFGVEFLTEQFEARANGYIPVGDTVFNVGQAASRTDALAFSASAIFVDRTTIQPKERIYPGFDAEVGYKVPKAPVNVFAGGYFFRANNVTVAGPRIRFDLKPLDWLIISGEYHYDKERNSHYYFGAGIRFTTSVTNSPFKLRNKMIQLPVRDVDAISLTKAEREVVRREAFQVDTFQKLREAIERGDQEIVVVADLDGGGQVATFGTDDKPVKSSIRGANVTRDGSGNITGVIAANKAIRNFVLPDGASPIPPRIELRDKKIKEYAQGFFGLVFNNNTLTGGIFVPSALIRYAEGGVFTNLTVDNYGLNGVPGARQAEGTSGLIGFGENVIVRECQNLQNMAADPNLTNVGIIGVAKNSNIVGNINRGEIGLAPGIAGVLIDSVYRGNISDSGTNNDGVASHYLISINSTIDGNLNRTPIDSINPNFPGTGFGTLTAGGTFTRNINEGPIGVNSNVFGVVKFNVKTFEGNVNKAANPNNRKDFQFIIDN